MKDRLVETERAQFLRDFLAERPGNLAARLGEFRRGLVESGPCRFFFLGQGREDFRTAFQGLQLRGGLCAKGD